MKTTRKTTAVAVALAALGAAGCGGSSDAAPTGPGVVGGPVTVKGAVQGSASGLVVNGVAFRTSGATFVEDGGTPEVLAGDDAIRARVGEGQVVTVRGTIDDGGASGEAEEIEVHDLVEGEIESRGPGHVVVAGTTVSIDDSTFVADRNGNPLVSDDLVTGERVEVSGHGDARGGVRATSIRRSADDAGVERELRAWVVAVSGTVVDLAFSPDGPVAVQVDVGGISPAPTVTVGTFVEVRTLGPAGAGGVLPATSIHEEDDFSPRVADRVEVEGIVTAQDAAGFTVGAQRVEASAATEFRGGTPEDVVPGVGLEVEGVLRADGVLQAHEVKFRPSARVEANAAAILPGAGTLSVLGLTVHVTPSTELRNLTSLDALGDGWTVQVRGNPTRDGNGLDATRVEVLDTASADRAFLRGVVDAKTPTSSLEILGFAIDTSAAEFRNLSDGNMTAAAFFDAIVPGETIVKVRWRPYPASTSEPVDQAELEN